MHIYIYNTDIYICNIYIFIININVHIYIVYIHCIYTYINVGQQQKQQQFALRRCSWGVPNLLLNNNN